MATYRIKRTAKVTVYDYIAANGEEILKVKMGDMDSLFKELDEDLADNHSGIKLSDYEEIYEKIDDIDD